MTSSLVVGPLRAYRCWRVEWQDGRPVLGSLFHSTVWPADGPLRGPKRAHHVSTHERDRVWAHRPAGHRAERALPVLQGGIRHRPQPQPVGLEPEVALVNTCVLAADCQQGIYNLVRQVVGDSQRYKFPGNSLEFPVGFRYHLLTSNSFTQAPSRCPACTFAVQPQPPSEHRHRAGVPCLGPVRLLPPPSRPGLL